MKLITRDTDYSIRALCYIAPRKRIIAVSELVKALRIPRPFLRKILQTLNKEGLLISSKGQGGGFRITSSADKIRILELIEIFQGKLTLNECFFRKMICPNKSKCRMKKKLDAIEKYVINELKSITLKELLK